MITEALISQISEERVGPNHEPLIGVSTDTRKTLTDRLFIPLVGEKYDGHDFIQTAIENGCEVLLWQQDRQLPPLQDIKVTVYLVKDTLVALQKLANCYRQNLKAKVIAITGSNGKTSTKDLVANVLKQSFNTHVTEGNLNNHIGVPLTILSAPETTEMLVLEMGMNHAGEIEVLSTIAQPDVAIITNIGESHIEFLKTRENIAKAKLEITSGLSKSGYLILDGDEPLLSAAEAFKIDRVSFYAEDATFIEDIKIKDQNTFFRFQGVSCFSIPFLGKHHAKNASYAILVAHFFGMKDESIQAGLSTRDKTGMRFEMIESGVHTLINDAYNASPTSMKGAIDILSALETEKQKILVLGDMYELGDQTERFHREIGKYIDQSIDFCLTVGPFSQYINEEVMINNAHVTTLSEATDCLKKLNKPSICLFKASRGMQFEKLIDSILED